MDEATSFDYRRRLMPFVERWRRRGTRVAVFGTGPHTDLLFDVVPELNGVRIAGYLDSNQDRQGTSYRGSVVHAPVWADDNADVILCSSWVSEVRMATAVEHLDCKVILSHTPPAGNDGQDAVARRIGSRTVIDWPEPVQFRRVFGPSRRSPAGRLYRQEAERLRHAAVLDAILDERFPFVTAPETDAARAILRYAVPGSTVFEFGSASAALTRLARLCSGPSGRLFALEPRCTLDGDLPAAAAEQTLVWMKESGRPGLPRSAAIPGEGRTEGDGWAPAFGRAIASFVSAHHPKPPATSFVRIGDPGHGPDLLRALQGVAARFSPTLLFSFDESRWSAEYREVFLRLARTGYELVSLEEGYGRVDALHYDAERRSAIVNILAVRTGRRHRSRGGQAR